jgi:hypothetical protein
LLIEETDYNLLFRWFLRLNSDYDVWDATSFAATALETALRVIDGRPTRS